MKIPSPIVLVAMSAATPPSLLLAADPAAGTAGWTKEYAQSDGSAARSCASCHGKKHDHITARLVKDNPEVVSFSPCNNCHRKAAEGDYGERQVNIPGHGLCED